ncbi:MAG: sigma-70 family RNA polymerase sigma factor [Bacillota bacterium]|nr:sigma-70 family RNA polymerase sigma factor [Bacillota bacterium]MDW7684931.1 sigma-70 family RNA polymerase sigma factor [Bacillota bacterium]
MKSIDELYQSYFSAIYRYLLSLCGDPYEAEDLVQETFFRAYLYLEHYRGENVKPWLFTVAHNAFIDYTRKQKRLVIREDSFFLTVPDRKVNILTKIIIDEEIDEILSRLGSLPDKQKFALLLHDFHLFSYHEAAAIMNVSPGHFKVLLYRARQAIRRKREG